MGEKVDAKFTKQDKSNFGEQKYVTSQLLQSFGESDMYLYNEVEKIQYLTPPAVRKRFNPVAVDGTLSYGYSEQENNIIFSNGGRVRKVIDFSNPNDVDIELSTVAINPRLDSDNNVIKTAETPTILQSTVNTECRDESPFEGAGPLYCNEAWYIAYNRNCEYRVQPNWLSGDESKGYGIYNTEIPAVGRAQTFKPTVDGVLEGITVNLKCSIDKNNTASPLIVQIRPTVEIDGIAYPANFQYTMLAEQRVRFSNTTPDITTIVFDNPCRVEAGKSYAVVFLSPLSHPYNCYYLGGWSKHCGADPYTDGDAFYTENNGATWIRYGKDEDVDYHLGKYAPQDFAFECQIRQDTQVSDKDKWHYLYLKPIMTNNIKEVEINANDNMGEDGVTIVYEISPNGREWFTMDHNQIKQCTPMWDMLFVRARMKTTNEETKAKVEYLSVTVTSDPSKQMFIRTATYYPRTEAMLGANIWGRIGAPFETDVGKENGEDIVTCEAEIISQKEAIEHFTVINLQDLVNYTWIDEIDESKVTNKTDGQIARYLQENSPAIRALKELGVYVLPYVHNDESTHFFEQFELNNSPAYPILSCILQPRNSITTAYGEWYDFMVNYGEKTLTDEIFNPHNPNEPYPVSIGKDCIQFYPDVLEEMPAGTFTIKYNPSYIKNLSNAEVGGDGLVVDYFKETFPDIDDSTLETRKIQLKCSPVDPLRKVILNPDTSNEELKEDIDFVVDYDKAVIEFLVNNTDNNSTALSLGDELEVVYTPNIEDCGLSIGYYATRKNSGKQCRIKPNFIEYKT